MTVVGALATLVLLGGVLAVLVVVGRHRTPAPDRAPLRTLSVHDVAREASGGWHRLVELHERATPTTPW